MNDNQPDPSSPPAQKRRFRLLPPLRKTRTVREQDWRGQVVEVQKTELHVPGIIARAVLGVVLLILGITMLTGITTVDSTERGVMFNRVTGDLVILDEGFHYVAPIFATATIYDVRQDTYTEVAIGMTDEKQEAHTEVTVLYSPDPGRIQNIHQKLGPAYERKVVLPAVQGCTKDAVGLVTIDNLTGQNRVLVNQNIVHCIEDRLREQNLLPEQITVTDFDFSKAVNDANERKAVAKQAAEEALFRQQQAMADANTTRIAAQAEADAARLLAEATTGQNGEAYMFIQCLDAWREGGSQVPDISNGAITPCLFQPGPGSSLIVTAPTKAG